MTQSRPFLGSQAGFKSFTLGRAEMKRYRLAVFVARAAPPHLGHLSVIQQALSVAETTLICIGSANAARSQHSVPFTAEEREQMIRRMLTSEENTRVRFAYIEDQGNMPKWTALVRRAANKIEADNKRITLIGHAKDYSSFYLRAFPGWSSINVANYLELSSTNFRNAYFDSNGDAAAWRDGLHYEVFDWLLDFRNTEAYTHLVEERQDVLATQKKYGLGPFITGTATIFHGDHVLLIKRGNAPFKGYWALPGGFVNPGEPVVEAAIREALKEEAKPVVKIPELVLRRALLQTRFYDDPRRDPRGRIIDFNSTFYLNPVPPAHMTDPKEIAKFLAPPKVIAGDDAVDAKFFPTADVHRSMMAFDHWLQFQNALDIIPRDY